MHITIVNILQLVFAAQACVYLMLTVSQPRLRPYALLLAVFVVHMAMNFVIDADVSLPVPDVTFAFRFAYGPLIYLFVREVIKEKAGLRPIDYLHALPFLVALPVASASIVYDILGVVSISAYFTCTILLVRRVHAGVDDIVSSFQVSRLDWITRAFFTIFVIGLFDVSHSIGARYWGFLRDQGFSLVSLAALIGLVNWFSLKALRYPEVFAGFTHVDLELLKTRDKELEPLDNTEERDIEGAISCLKSRRLYLKPQLKVADLASVTGLKERFLSRALYLHTGQRFNQYINTLRIEAAMERLDATRDKPLNILALSYEVGFNSKSVFNHAFKAISGMTPSEYRERQK